MLERYKKEQIPTAVLDTGKMPVEIPPEIKEDKRLMNWIQGFEPNYFSAFTLEEIHTHFEYLSKIKRGEIFEFHRSHQHYSWITVLTTDRKRLLADVCGCLTLNWINIIDAQIFTDSRGLVVDRFRVVDSLWSRNVSESDFVRFKDFLIRANSGDLHLKK
jgi:[protein-PII] uridylyltransferase